MDNPHSSEIDLNKKEKFALSKRYNTICIPRENLKILLSQNIIPQPFIDLKMLANEGSAKAQFEVGLCYLRGFQVEQSDTSTFEYYLLAAKQGFLQAYFPLAYCYQYGIGIPISLSNALIYYEKGSNQKDPACQYFLGKMHQEGNVVEKSLNQAICYYQRAAKEGYLPAILHLAQAYYEGSDLIQLQKKEHTFYEVSDYNGDPNLDNALKYYKKAADANFIPAMKITAHLYEILFPNSLDKAFYYYRKFADINFNQGWFDVFRCLLNGIGVGKSEEQALRYLKMALEQNLENSSYALGLYYLQIGKIEEAYESIQQAADKGDPKAQYHIGTCYDNGQIEQESYYAPINPVRLITVPYFIKPSIELAVKYYKLAANQNYAPAQEKIGDCYLYGIEVEKSIDQAFLYYKKAADQHYAPAQCKAGLILEQIKGDSKQAFKYYNFARLQKNLKGMCLYGLCKEKGVGTKINRSIAHRYFKDAADLGYPEGIFHLARSLEYEFELGIRLSGKKALYYYKRALQLGYDKLDDEREFIEEHIQIILKRMEDELYDIRNILIKEDVLLSESEKLNLSTNYGKKTNLEKVLELKEIFQENQQKASYLILSTISKEEAEVICDAMIDNKKFTLITTCGHKKIHLAFEKAGYDSNTCFKNHFFRIYGSGHIAYLLKEDQEPCFEEMTSDAFLVLKEQADEGFVEDQFLVGTCYQKGNGVQQSDKKAVYYYNLAAGKKHQKALVELGKSFEYGIGVKQSLSNSIKCYRALNEGVEKWKLLAHIHSHYPEEKSYSFTKAYYKELFNYYQFKAEEDAESQAILGNYFEIGLGIDKNLEQAIKYYKLSVQQNHPMGLCYLGECYEFGIGVDRSVEQAISYYKLASNQNSLRALYCLAKCLFNNNQEHLAIEYFKQLANNPSDFQGQAQYLLGVCYEKGISCEKSEKIALEYYQLAAHNRTAIAQDRLGDAYRKGELGIKIDPYIAFDYYRKATELNCMFSAEKVLHYYRIHQRYSLPKQEKHINFIFSNFYEVFGKYQQGADEYNAIYSEENLKLLCEAASHTTENTVLLYQFAAENGSSYAQYKLGQIYLNAWYKTEKNEKLALYYYNKAASQNYLPSIEALGHCYEEGKGIEQSLEKAFEQYKRCVELNLNESSNEGTAQLARCFRDGIGITKDLEAAIYYYKIDAIKGNTPSYYEIGSCLQELQREDEAIHYYLKGTKHKNLSCQLRLAQIFENKMDYKKSLYYHKLVENQVANVLQTDRIPQSYDRKIMELLIKYLETGMRNLSNKAFFHLYKHSAEHMHFQILMLVTLYYSFNASKYQKKRESFQCLESYIDKVENGLLKLDSIISFHLDRTVFEFYLLLSDVGLATASYLVGVCLEYGIGVKPSLKEALAYYQKAADQKFDFKKSIYKARSDKCLRLQRKQKDNSLAVF